MCCQEEVFKLAMLYLPIAQGYSVSVLGSPVVVALVAYMSPAVLKTSAQLVGSKVVMLDSYNHLGRRYSTDTGHLVYQVTDALVFSHESWE